MNYSVNGHNIFFIVFTTFIFSLILVPIVKRIAQHIGAIDYPNERKVHTKPTPRLGGLAIFLSFLLGYIFFGEITVQMISILISGFILILVGICDDIKPLKAKYKFIVQLIAALIVVFYGNIYIPMFSAFGSNINFGIYGYPLAVLFIVAIINAINLIDGLDGLAAGTCSIFYLTTAILSFYLVRLNGLDVILCLLMLGSTLGFLIYNFCPASIFMGDTGSMFLGFMIAVIGLLGYKGTTVTSLIVPIIILFLPILDTIFAIIRRIIKGESIGKADKAHIHHQLLKLNKSVKKTVLIMYSINLICASISIFYVLGDNKIAIILYIIILIIAIILIFKTDIIFDHHPHKIEEKKNQYEKILGFKVCSYSKNEILNGIEKDLINNNQNIVFNINPLIINNFYKQPLVVKTFNKEKYNIPDGIGIIYASKFNNGLIKERITGIDIFLNLCSIANNNKKTIFLYGSKEEIVNKTANILKQKYPNISKIDYINGYVDEELAIKNIIKSQPDMLFIALGSPKQEEFIIKYQNKLNKIMLIMPIGGSMDVISGSLKAAPKIWQNLHLEWLYRMIQEPKRFKQFFKLIKFLMLVIFKNNCYNEIEDDL